MVLRWKKPAVCFFCNEEVRPRPTNPRQFLCPHCDCWNRYDANGDIMSDDHAMYDESMNASAFAKRASPRKDKLPTVHQPRVFCRTCQTNQTLHINLLSNYLPDEDDPNYDHLLAQLPAYEQSLNERYPLVCADCAGNVDEELNKSERLGRSNALGSWLKGNGASRSRSWTYEKEGTGRKRVARAPSLWVWRARGCLWLASAAASIAGSTSAMRDSDVLDMSLSQALLVPTVAVVSILWSFWDPMWSIEQSVNATSGWRRRWIFSQSLLWLSRFVTSIALCVGILSQRWLQTHLTIEISLLTASAVLVVLRRKAQSASSLRVRLTGRSRSLTPYPTTVIHTTSSTRDTSLPPNIPPPSSRFLPPSTAQSDDFLSSLSLSAEPTIPPPTAPHPMFGRTSHLGSSSSLADEVPVSGEDAMDWDPIAGTPQSRRSRHESEVDWMRPQRFFPPSEPTGLEDLLSTASLGAPSQSHSQSHPKGGIAPVTINSSKNAQRRRRGDAMSAYLAALLVAVLAASALLIKTGSWRMSQRWNGSDSTSSLELEAESDLFAWGGRARDFWVGE